MKPGGNEGCGVGGAHPEVRDAPEATVEDAVELTKIRQGQLSYACPHTIARSEL